MTTRENFHGFININKDSGPTSTFLVSTIKKLFNGINRVGHCGTLDPMATGVLPICVGQATRLSEFFLLTRKKYKVTGKFGSSTDTYDSLGKVTQKSNIYVSGEELAKALNSFSGIINQRPPLFSALKYKGERLYKIARRGEKYIPPDRKVKVFNIDLIKYDFPEFQLDIRVSSGFYVRSLIHDLGTMLGCGSHMVALERTAVGDFNLSQSVTLKHFSNLVKKGNWKSKIVPIDYVLKDLPRIIMTSEQTKQVKNGVNISLSKVYLDPKFYSCDKLKFKGYDNEGKFTAILEISEEGEFLKPKKVFHEI